MIAAILNHTQAVRVDDTGKNSDGQVCARITAIGRGNLGQAYIGGMGYVSVPFVSVVPDELTAVAELDDNDELLQNWIDAIATTDAVGLYEDSAAFMAAMADEEEARRAFVEHVEANALMRVQMHAPIIEPAIA